MPISPRLSGRIYPRITDLVDNCRDFIFFGSYNVALTSGIMRRIINKKRNNNAMLVACLLPPPSDFIIWDFSLRPRLHQAYNIPNTRGPRINEEIANNPVPAYALLDSLWTENRANRALNEITGKIGQVSRLYQEGIIVMFEPNTHAKFIASDYSIYEGSGNLSTYGLTVNVEIFNFYPRRVTGVYNFAWSSYEEFLINYLSNYVEWKIGVNFLRNAQRLGDTISDFVNALGLRFNPRIYSEKIYEIQDVLTNVIDNRPEVWMMPGHKNALRIDFLLRIASDVLYDARGTMYDWRDQEVDGAVVNDIHNKLDLCSKLLVHVKNLISEHESYSDRFADYELEYGEKITSEASRFLSYLKEGKGQGERYYRE